MKKQSFVQLIILGACLVIYASCRTMPEEVTDAKPEEALPFLKMPSITQDIALKVKADAIAAGLDDNALIGQVIMTAVDGNGSLYAASRNRLREIKPGAVLLFKTNLDGTSAGIKQLNQEIINAASLSVLLDGKAGLLKPFIAVDHEGGLVNRFGSGVEALPAPLSYRNVYLNEGKDSALKKIEDDAYRSGREIAALGFSMNLAPVVEILDTNNSRFLASRSYGFERDFVPDAAAAFIEGMRRANMLCVIKHFPGNSNLDPHETRPVLPLSEAELALYAEPFAQTIRKASPSGLMVSHVVVPEWDAQNNASLSPAVIEGQIRGTLKFSRIVITDDLAMGALSALSHEEAAVRAIIAGADMVITWQSSLQSVYAALQKALSDGRLTRERLSAAAARIIMEKLRILL